MKTVLLTGLWFFGGFALSIWLGKLTGLWWVWFAIAFAVFYFWAKEYLTTGRRGR